MTRVISMRRHRYLAG